MTISSISSDTSYPTISKAPAVFAPTTSVNAAFTTVLKASSTSSFSSTLNSIFEAAGQKYNLSPDLLKAVAKVESGFNADTTSRVGAMGIMQLMPSTAQYLGVTDAYDPEQNIMGGARYLREMLDKFNGDLTLALAAYNAGPGAIINNGNMPLESQLNGYISKVLGLLNYGEITPDVIIYKGETANANNADNVSGENSGADGSGAEAAVAAPDAASNAGTTDEYLKSVSEMLLMRILEMQMGSSEDTGIFG